MNQFQEYAISIALAKSLYQHGSWCGETHLQKAMYFLNEFSCLKLDLDFILYKHGPYSFEFHDTLDELKMLKLLEHEYIPPYGPRLKTTSRGEWLIDNQFDTVSIVSKTIQLIADCVGGKNVKELEKISTALYVWREMPSATIEKRSNRLSEIKSHITYEEAYGATKHFEESILPCFSTAECVKRGT